MQHYLCNNPAVLQRADPWIYKHNDGYYYFIATVPEFDRIELRRSKELSNIGGAEQIVVWRKYEEGEMSANIWAPELHYINNKWYIYFAAANCTEPVNGLFDHRLYVLENENPSPISGVWKEKGKVTTPWNSFALDATTFQYNGEQYIVWAQKHPEMEGNSNLYISLMENPWTLKGLTTCLSKPEFDWEKKGFLVNEGPAILTRDNRIYITYSCSATDANYCMGLLYADLDSDLLNPSSWEKSSKPVFSTSEDNGQFGPGHNCFTRSEDDTMDLLVYHARNYPEIIIDPLKDPNRHTRIQPFTWSDEGFPVFKAPVKDGPLFYMS